MIRYRVKAENGTLTAYNKPKVQRMLERLDGDYAVEIKQWSEHKSWEQLKLYYGYIVRPIADYTGFTEQEIDAYIKQYAGWIHRTENPYTGEEVMYEEKQKRNATLAEMSELIDKAFAFRAEFVPECRLPEREFFDAP